jgi:hypothetical protein
VAGEVAKAYYCREQECPEDTCGGGHGPFHVHVFSSLSFK